MKKYCSCATFRIWAKYHSGWKPGQPKEYEEKNRDMPYRACLFAVFRRSGIWIAARRVEWASAKDITFHMFLKHLMLHRCLRLLSLHWQRQSVTEYIYPKCAYSSWRTSISWKAFSNALRSFVSAFGKSIGIGQCNFSAAASSVLVLVVLSTQAIKARKKRTLQECPSCWPKFS